MKKPAFPVLFTAFLAVFMALTVSPALAGPKFYGLWWWPSHWENQDFIPYYDNGTDPHPHALPDEKPWKVEDWTSQKKGGGMELVRNWYTVDIFRDQYMDGDEAVLEVGPNFYHLSAFDKKRVVATLDSVYGVTQKRPGMFYLKDYKTGKYIGNYSATGLMLQ